MVQFKIQVRKKIAVDSFFALNSDSGYGHLHGCAHENHSKGWGSGRLLLYQCQQEVRFHLPLMDFIDDNMRHSFEERRVLHLPEKN